MFLFYRKPPNSEISTPQETEHGTRTGTKYNSGGDATTRSLRPRAHVISTTAQWAALPLSLPDEA